jgi:type I restriction enzyme S subunit
MNRYNSYKDSGVEWIGEIPNHWKRIKLKHQYKIQKGRIPKNLYDEPKEGLIPYLSMDVLRGSNSYNFADLNDGVLVKKDEILILWDGSNSGEILKVEIDGILSSTMGVLNTVNCYLNKDFSFYQLKYNEAEIRNNTNGMGIPHVDGGYVRNLPVFVPPLNEQEQIVAYLDKKTSIVDTLIASKEEKINLLKENRTALINHAITKGLDPKVKLKDSGVEWIGEIPAHWLKTKIKRFCEVKDGTHDTPQYIDDIENSIPLVTSNSFRNGEIDFSLSKRISIEDWSEINKRSNVVKNDVIMSMIGSNIGNRVLIKTDESFSIKNVCLFKSSNSKKLNPKYLLFLIDSKYLKYQVDFNQKGGGQPFMSLDDLRNLIFPFPQLSEQNKIVEYLDTHTQEIDELISLEQKKIETLKEYRQALISEVVTGKIKVVK